MANYSNPVGMSGGSEETSALDTRPGGMVDQKRDDGDSGSTHTTLTLKLSYGAQQLDLTVPSDSTFGHVKDNISQVIGLEPKVQKLLFRGKEKEDQDYLFLAGVKDNSKLVLMEDTTSYEKKSEKAKVRSEISRVGDDDDNVPEEVKGNSEISRGGEAVTAVRVEVDKLLDQVDALQVVVHGGTRVDEKDIVFLTEMLMRQLLKLDSIEAEGEGKLQRKEEVRRVQSLVDKMDVLKAKNLNPFHDNSNNPPVGDNSKAVSVKTEWETVDSVVGSLHSPPPPTFSPPSSLGGV
ncbi:unnamed protein product [Cuscuta europaea]|uniref:BAG family molecular chaperone regulator 4 n=1 Tax=Cuscuta europaea TaxID=41803 RepID=A0A9P0YJI5_CUSEU|nr:unnamed protein product [Cuscuta europaea]